MKIGDKVRIIDAGPYDLNDEQKTGIIIGLATKCSRGKWRVELDNYLELSFYEKEMEVIEKTWDNLEVGDVLLTEYGNGKTILGMSGKVFLLSAPDEPESYGGSWTISDMKRHGWTIKQSLSEDVTIEIEGKKKVISRKSAEALGWAITHCRGS